MVRYVITARLDSGDNGSILYADDPGGPWTRVLVGDTEWRTIAYSEVYKRWVIIGQASSAASRHPCQTSEDGVTWTSRLGPPRPNPGSPEWGTMCWGPGGAAGRFVVPDTSGAIGSSATGTSGWSTVHTMTSGAAYQAVWDAFNERFLVGGSDYLAISDDGATWTEVASGEILEKLAASSIENRLVAIDNFDRYFYSTNDGATWTQATTPPSSPDNANAIAWVEDRGLFVSVHDNGVFFESADGNTWSAVSSSPGGGYDGNSLGVFGSDLISPAQGSRYYRSTDGGDTWTLVDLTSVVSNLWFIDVASESLNEPPNAPTQTNPVGGATIDRTSTERFAWTFDDPDDGDTQSAFDLEIRLQGETALDVDVSSETTNSYYDLAGSTLAVGDYEWRVRTTDAAGEIGPWSSWEPFVAAEPPATPTIVDPTSGQTIATEDHPVEWSTSSQDAYQLRRVADDAGSPDPATVYLDTGTVSSSGTRSRTVTFETNNRWEHVQVRILRDGLWSEWASVRVEVAYTVPATPTLIVEPKPAVGYVELSWTHPAPVDPEPAVIETRIYRTTGSGEELLLAVVPAGTDVYLDRTAGARVDHVYRIVAVGDNGTTTSSAASAPTTLELTGVWIHPIDDPTALRHHRANNQGGTSRRTVEQATNRYAGRTYPAVEYGEGREQTVDVELAITDYADLSSLFDLEAGIVCYRDAAGRRLFGTLAPIDEEARPIYGWDVSLEISAVDHDETVSP